MDRGFGTTKGRVAVGRRPGTIRLLGGSWPPGSAFGGGWVQGRFGAKERM